MAFTPIQINPPTTGFKPVNQPQKSLAEKIWGGLSGVVSAVEQPFISLASKPVQLLAKGLGQPDPYAGGIPAGLPGASTRAEVSPASLKGIAGDVLKAGATTAGVAAAPATLTGALAAGAGIGGATFAGEALQEEKPLTEVAKQGGIGAALGFATAGVVSGVSKLLGFMGEKIQRSVLKPSKVDIEDGFSMDTLKKYDLGGSLQKVREKTQLKLNELTNELNSKLASSQSRIDLNDIYTETVKELTDSSRLKGFGANTKIANIAQQLKEEINIVSKEGGVSIPDAQILKQAAGHFGAWQYGKPDPDSKAVEIVYNTFYSKIKNAIEKSSPEGVKGLNQELSRLIPVMNAVIRRLPVAERANLVSLNEMIGLVGSAVNPIALGPTLLAIISRSGTAGNVLSKVAPVVQSAVAPAATVTSSLVEQGLDTKQ